MRPRRRWVRTFWRSAAAAALLGAAFRLAGLTRVQPPGLKPDAAPVAVVRLIYAEGAGAMKAWPGFSPLESPALLALPRGALLLDPRGEKRGFFKTPALDPLDVRVSWRTFEPGAGYVDGFALDGSTVAAYRLSRGWEPRSAARGFLHRRFMSWQRAHFRPNDGPPVAVGLDPRERALERDERRALARWTLTGDEDAMRAFARARRARRAAFPSTRGEDEGERLEGTASFVELAGAAMQSPPGAVSRELAARLEERALDAQGAALCRWLEAHAVPGWRDAVERGRTPSELALARLPPRP